MSEALIRDAIQEVLTAALDGCPDRAALLRQLEEELPALMAQLHPDADPHAILKIVQAGVARERVRA